MDFVIQKQERMGQMAKADKAMASTLKREIAWMTGRGAGKQKVSAVRIEVHPSFACIPLCHPCLT
jgi:hypothetical protein